MVAISSSETAARCAGLKENGGAALWWMDIEAPDVSEWKNLTAVRHGFKILSLSRLTASRKNNAESICRFNVRTPHRSFTACFS